MEKKFVILIFFLFFFSLNAVNAQTSANLKLEGESIIYANSTYVVDIKATDIKESKLMTAGGHILSSNESCLSLINLESIAPGLSNNNTFAYSLGSGMDTDFVIARATFKASNNSCKSDISIDNPKLAFTNNTRLSLDNIIKSIEVISLDEVKINKNSLTLRVNETAKLNLYTPSFQINENLSTWSIKNPDIAEVNKEGLIKGLKKGKTTLEAILQNKKFSSTIEVVDFLKGDLNRDGNIDLSDVLLALRIQMYLTTITDSYLEVGDINNDGVIDLTDVLYILRVQMGL